MGRIFSAKKILLVVMDAKIFVNMESTGAVSHEATR